MTLRAEPCYSQCAKYYSLRCRWNTLFYFLSDVHPQPRCYISVCNRVFVLRADTDVCGLFCICVFVSIKGLTVISEVAKGDLASVIILFTSIMELNIEESDSWEQTRHRYFNPRRLIFSSSRGYRESQCPERRGLGWGTHSGWEVWRTRMKFHFPVAVFAGLTCTCAFSLIYPFWCRQ